MLGVQSPRVTLSVILESFRHRKSFRVRKGVGLERLGFYRGVLILEKIMPKDRDQSVPY